MNSTSAPPRSSLSFEETLRQIVREVVREEMRTIMREELAAALVAPVGTSQADVSPIYVTPKEAAEITNVSEKTIRRWVQHGGLHATEIGRLIRIKRIDLDEFMARSGGASRSTKSADEVALAVLGRRRR